MNINNNKHLQYPNHSINQARGNSGTPISFHNNITTRRRLSSSQADQIDHSNLYGFDGDDDYAYNTNSVYASPFHLPRRLHSNELPANTYRDDSRRVNIVISSPQRYIRPAQARRMRATGQQFWSDTLPKSAPQDYLYFNGSQNSHTNGGTAGGATRRPFTDIQTSRLTQMDYRHSSPSPVGSQSGWSSYGSINRDNVTVESHTGNSYDENAEQKLAQLQYQQQKNSKQRQASANYYQTDDSFSPKLSNEMKLLSQRSSTYFNDDNGNEEVMLGDTILTNRRKSSKIKHELEKQDYCNLASRSTQQQLIDKSCSVQKADLSGSYAVSSEKEGSRIDGDKIETEVSNRPVQQLEQQQSRAKQQQQNLVGGAAANISNKRLDLQVR